MHVCWGFGYTAAQQTKVLGAYAGREVQEDDAAGPTQQHEIEKTTSHLVRIIDHALGYLVAWRIFPDETDSGWQLKCLARSASATIGCSS